MPSLRARSSASSPHGYQSTGLCRCWSRYGEVSLARWFMGRLSRTFPPTPLRSGAQRLGMVGTRLGGPLHHHRHHAANRALHNTADPFAAIRARRTNLRQRQRPERIGPNLGRRPRGVVDPNGVAAVGGGHALGCIRQATIWVQSEAHGSFYADLPTFLAHAGAEAPVEDGAQARLLLVCDFRRRHASSLTFPAASRSAETTSSRLCASVRPPSAE